MRRSPWSRWVLAASLAAGCLCAVARPSWAIEETDRFLASLREDGLYDMALEYLDQMRDSPLAGEEFKTAIDYEAGVTLIAGSHTIRKMSLREGQLDRAEQRFKKFLAEHPQHSLASSANTQLANLMVERGRIKTEQAGGASASAAEKKRLLGDARALYQEAEKVLTESEKQFLKDYRDFPKVIAPKDTKTREQKVEAARRLAEARLAVAQVGYHIAETYEPGSKEHADNLKAAAAKYHALYEKYEGYPAGLYARLWEGRCYKDMGETGKAFEALEELLAGPDDSPPFRRVKNSAMVLYLETALLPKEGKYKEALAAAEKWEQSARGAEDSSPDGLAIKYLAGEAGLEYAKSFKEKKDAKSRNILLADAKKRFEFVANFPGEYQRKAREAMTRPEFVGEDFVPPEPDDFADARDRATDELYRSEREDLKPEEAAEARSEAIKHFRMAMEMTTPEVTADEMNVIRYRLAYLYYKSGDLYEAAVIGEFLARRYPDGVGGREGAEIAMAAYEQMFYAAPPDDRQFETDRMIGFGRYVAEYWKGQPVADKASAMLVRAALKTGDLDGAQEYLQQVPADSPRRGEIELMTGQSLWAAYLRDSRKPESERPSQEVLDKMVSQARKTLEDGIARMRKPVDEGGEVSQTLAAAVLSLAQIHIGTEEPQQAVKWLEDEHVGARTLVQKKDPATAQGNFRVETDKAALQAYVALQEVDKAREVLKDLEELTKESGGAQASRNLTRIYISLGQELKDQLERLRSQQKLEQRKKVAEAFEAFLDSVSKRAETFSSLNWVAATYFGLGAGSEAGVSPASQEAKSYYKKAADNYQKILKRWDDPNFGAPADPNEHAKAADAITIRLAKCLRGLGQYNQALQLLLDILKRRPMMVDAQVEAAYTYQARGAERPAAYLLAITGSSKYKQIWGWGKIAAMVARSAKHESIFHEARYNLALCRFRLAQSKTKKEERQDFLQQAERDIRVVYRLYPKMGQGLRLEPGDKDWYEKYDDLLKQIQRLSGKKAEGLKGL